MTTQTKHDGLIGRLQERHQSINREAAEAIQILTAENERLRDAAENLLIAIGMGWDLESVCDVLNAALSPQPEGQDND